MQQLQENVEYCEVTLKKCKVAPLTDRYTNGGFQSVETRQTSDKPTRKVILGLDNSHSSDYKVGYASDPVLVFQAPIGYTHSELKQTLQRHNLWNDNYQPIDVPHGNDYQAAFQTSTSETSFFETYAERLKSAADRELDVREGSNGLSAYVPYRDA